MAGIREAEGFFDEKTGMSVIIAGNVRLAEGQTPEQALKRVIVHERIGHDGMNGLLGADATMAQRWESLQHGIPEAELGAIAKQRGYERLAEDRHGLALEWLARKVESDPRVLETDSLLRQLWDTLKHGLQALYVKAGLGDAASFAKADFDREVLKIMTQARQAALRPRR